MDLTLAEMKVEKMMMKSIFNLKVCLETCPLMTHSPQALSNNNGSGQRGSGNRLTRR
jgi:hypothetical protein